jgi:hypothetical protein
MREQTTSKTKTIMIRQPKREANEKHDIEYVKRWVQSQLYDFIEPIRTGVPKGKSIGFSRAKKQAALFMVLYPNGADIESVAKISKVRTGVLQVWRTQEPFREEVEKSYHRFADTFWNATENDVAGWKNSKSENPDEAKRAFKRALQRFKILRSINPAVFELLMLRAAQKIREGDLTYAIFAPGQSIHTIYQARPFKTATRKFLMARRILIEEMIEKLTDPSLREKNSEEEIRAFAETIQKEIGDTFYILLEEIDYGSEKARREQFETGKSNSTPDRGKQNCPRWSGKIPHSSGS